MSAKKVIIIGGGPSGLMAAGQAAESGAETILLEKMNRTGLKLGITGKGRCNVTNRADLPEFIMHFGKNGRFLRQAFTRFFTDELMEFFTDHNVKLVTERGGRVFPASGKALDIVKTLRNWLGDSQVLIECSSPVEEILVDGDHISSVLSRGREIFCDSIILASGGASYPATGSTGDGYAFARLLGHSIIPVRQALVPLETSDAYTGRMDKLNLRNVHVCMFINGKKKREAFGELGFTKFGITGPTILSFSGEAVDSLREGREVDISIDLKPALDEKKLDDRLLRDIKSQGKENISNLLKGLVPWQMVSVCIKKTTIPSDRKVCDISAKERMMLRKCLKNFSLHISGYRPFSESIVTSGGIDTREINPRTMESRIVKGLYFAGEVIDIQADTGGYNLQAAFSTGWLAGQSAARKE